MNNNLKMWFKLVKISFSYLSNKKYYLYIITVNIFLILLSLINPLFYKLFIDEVVMGKRIEIIYIIVIGYLCVFVSKTLFSYLSNYLNNYINNTVMYRLKLDIIKHYLNMDYESYSKQEVGEVKLSIHDDINKTINFTNTHMLSFVQNSIIIVFSSILMININYKLSIFSLLSMPFVIYIDYHISKKEKLLVKNNRINNRNMSTWFQSCMNNWAEVKLLNAEKKQEKQLIKYMHNFAIFFSTWINYWVLRVLVIPNLRDEFILKFCIYFFGGLLISKGELKIGDLLLFATYFQMFSNSVNTVSNLKSEFQSNLTIIESTLNKLTNVKTDKSRKKTLSNITNITLDNISFNYEDINVFNNVSLKLENSTITCILGKSGKGKSTLLKVIGGLLTNNTTGSIYYSNENINNINLDKLQRKITFVMQNSILLNDTIKENLLIGNKNITNDEIVSICKKVNALEFIENFPKKFDEVIGINGAKLSSGQRQKIILARALLSDSDVFIFDEVISDVDSLSEHYILQTIKQLSYNKIIIVVSHKQSVINICDNIFEL